MHIERSNNIHERSDLQFFKTNTGLHSGHSGPSQLKELR